ncbi:MAG TPA: hypothetical protein VLF68_01580 [Candidatus Saccharimonadales bacterium]|nr:hypothetical protein [Candidatus Saccharimonadales bacterium]
MKKEKVVLSFVAVLAGLLVAAVAFYFYQRTKILPKNQTISLTITPTPRPANALFLNIDNPKDEDVVSKKVVTVSGKTFPDATIAIITDTDQQVVTPTASGDFSTTVTIEDGANIIEVTAIAPTGEEIKQLKTVTYSTENF